MIVLDTNIVSEIGKATPDGAVVAWWRAQERAQLFLCGPVLMEQVFGAERYFLKFGSDRFRRAFDTLISKTFVGRILILDNDAAMLAGKLRSARERSGRLMSIGDAMIAAICVVHGATLATRNMRDFEGLDVPLVNPFQAAD